MFARTLRQHRPRCAFAKEGRLEAPRPSKLARRCIGASQILWNFEGYVVVHKRRQLRRSYSHTHDVKRTQRSNAIKQSKVIPTSYQRIASPASTRHLFAGAQYPRSRKALPIAKPLNLLGPDARVVASRVAACRLGSRDSRQLGLDRSLAYRLAKLWSLS